MNEQILFMYAAPQGGHKECADAIRKAINAIQPRPAQTFAVDVITYLYPILGSLVAKAYFEILRYTPQIWDFLYDNHDIEETTRELRQFFNSFNASKINLLLSEYQPTAFVCTHAISCGLIAENKKRGTCNYPLIAVITDYAVHCYWIYPEVDLYIVANAGSAETLLAKGIAKEKIKICGIPINPGFEQKIEKQAAKTELGLNPGKPVVLVMGGSRGWGPMEEIVQTLSSLNSEIQTVVVAGSNKDLHENLNKLQLKNLKVYGFTNSVSLLMDAADLLITKPGGLTSSEALAKQLPMILLNPIAGQEERNARYLLEHRTALQAKSIAELKDMVKSLAGQPDQLKQMSLNCKKIAAPSSASYSAQEILAIL